VKTQRTINNTQQVTAEMGQTIQLNIHGDPEFICARLQREQKWILFDERCKKSSAQRKSWRFDRDEANQR
jgi:antitoxin component of MazEF toxin-antitoxin module